MRFDGQASLGEAAVDQGGVQVSANEVAYPDGGPVIAFPMPGEIQAPASSTAALKAQGASDAEVATIEQQAPAPPAPKLPDHSAYQQIMAVFAAADHPPRARHACDAMDLTVAPNYIRLKLKRLTDRGILAEIEQGLFTQSRP